jgi:hypothetical protein
VSKYNAVNDIIAAFDMMAAGSLFVQACLQIFDFIMGFPPRRRCIKPISVILFKCDWDFPGVGRRETG